MVNDARFLAVAGSVRKIVAETLNLGMSAIDIDTTAEDIDSWDSMEHLRIVLAIEAEFDVQFQPDELGAHGSVRSLVEFVSSHSR